MSLNFSLITFKKENTKNLIKPRFSFLGYILFFLRAAHEPKRKE